MIEETLAELIAQGVRTLRMSYPDLHGIARGKEFPVRHLEHLAEDGAAFCEAIMTVDLRHNVIAGPEHGFQDIVGRPDLSTWCRCRGTRRWRGAWPTCSGWTASRTRSIRAPACGGPSPATSGARVSPVVGPELEFYICGPDPTAPHGYRRYVDNDSHVYTVGSVADPHGVLRRDAARLRRPRPGRLRRQPRVRPRAVRDQPRATRRRWTPADRAFRFKDTVKELAARHGLLATFIGKPWNDDEGSGFHLHLSLADDDGANVLNGDLDEGLSPLAHHFVAGLLEHGAGADGVLQPHHQRLPAHPRGGAGADAGQLGPRQPADAGARPARARRRDPARAAAGRRRGQRRTWPPPPRCSPAWTGSSASWSRRRRSRA